MISAIEWLPVGVADPSPKKYEFSPAELELIQMMEEHNMNDLHDVQAHLSKEKEESEKTSKQKQSKKSIPSHDLPADLRMDEYSSEEDDDEAVQGTKIGRLLVEDDNDDNEMEEEIDDDKEKDTMAKDSDDDDESDDDDDLADVPDTREYTPVDLEGLKAIGLSQIGTNAPAYMDGDDDDEDENDSDAEDVRLQPNDAIVVVAKTEDDFAALEIHVYEPETGNLFVHHDIPLPAFPLSLAHGDISPNGTAGNFCAVGTFTPGIEIWNLDVLNALEPSCILGGEDTSMADEIMRHNIMNSSASKMQKQKMSMSRGSSLKAGSHTDAVMSLSWNKVHRQVIASGSADFTVKLWDVTQANSNQANATTMKHHKGKVQSVLWHPQEGTLLATGSYDRTVALVDARNSDNVKRVKLPADCEALAWDPFNPQFLTAASEDGTVTCWDVRKFSDKTPLWSMVANEYGGVSDLSYNHHVPGMLATCSVDKTVTLWDTYDAEQKLSNGPPKAKMNKDMRVGKLYTVNFYPSSPWLLGCAGGAKEIALWDMSHDDNVQRCFGGRSGIGAKNVQSEHAAGEKQEAFDAMMTPTASSQPTKEANAEKSSTKSKKKNKNKKVHKAGR
ncbi:WD-40 repeat-containing protein [Nitzschia inconspicua]|uniref:WD-40 repeat-containing protein n=1 Tax=Nitzschia inconspicua TaxID=303405 RepID=A0A9K3LJ34_9STRA|nr:WD-40 repeat-containing protein [Nitzschia inconspicua]